jgi:hypothetical protein
VLQFERGHVAIMESLGGSCRSLEVRAEPPERRLCAELIGDGCSEVALCGGGVDLSRFGYELVLSGQTWARLPPLDAVGPALPSSLAAMVGAARHACGLAPTDAVACVPPAG